MQSVLATGGESLSFAGRRVVGVEPAQEREREMRSLLTYTSAEKRGMIDGIGLFFGALLGTNLGSIGNLGKVEYALLILALAGTVMALRIFSTTERRWNGYLLLSTYSLTIYYFLFVTKVGKDIALADRERLAITLAVWLAVVVLTELTPIKELAPKAEPTSTGTSE
jgi:hypothetical protein